MHRDIDLIQHLQKLPSFPVSYNLHRPLTKSLTFGGINIDLNNQYFSEEICGYLLQMLNKIHLNKKLHNLFSGNVVNLSQNQPALHTLLRQKNKQNSDADSADVADTLRKMKHFSSSLRTSRLNPQTGKRVTDIVNIGMGGSDLGPRMGLKALKHLKTSSFDFHFISDADPDAFDETLSKLTPETTLFIISSKSFKTPETIQNMLAIISWSGYFDYAKTNMVAVTANQQLAKKYGIDTSFNIGSSIGGRYSFCSAINLILMIAIGEPSFQEMLDGAHDMDTHVIDSPFHRNMAVMLALTEILNVNGRLASNRAMLIYGSPLSLFLPYLQQLEMESNGKMLSQFDEPLSYKTAPVLWGGMGNQAQHAYFQLLCEGTHLTPCDILLIKSQKYEKLNQYAYNVMQQLQTPDKPKGRVPYTLITLDELTPSILGALIALFEHKTFITSTVWNINPFDQPAVDRAKSNKSDFSSVSPQVLEPA